VLGLGALPVLQQIVQVMGIGGVVVEPASITAYRPTSNSDALVPRHPSYPVDPHVEEQPDEVLPVFDGR